MKNPFTITLLVLLGISVTGNFILYDDVGHLNTDVINLNDSIKEINGELTMLQNEINASGCIGEGFGSTRTLSLTELRNYQSEYKLPAGEKTTGGIISLDAFKAMGCISSCNAIAYTFGRNGTSGDKGPNDNGVFIMLRGVNVTYDATNDVITAVNNINSAVYYGGYWCPNACLPTN